MRFFLVLCLALSACDFSQNIPRTPPKPAHQNLPAEELISKLKSGGLVLYVRHSPRDKKQVPKLDPKVDLAQKCQVGSELTAEGKVEAKKIGEKLRSLGIKFDEVIATPTCRTRQTAELMIGKKPTTETKALFPAAYMGGHFAPGEGETLRKELQKILGTKPKAGINNALVAHEGVLEEVGVSAPLDMSDMAVIEPLGDSSYRMLGLIKKSYWLNDSAKH